MGTLLTTEADVRLQRAEAVKNAADVSLPRLAWWNYDPCAAHSKPEPGCEYRACGGELFSHQRVGVMWLYLRKKGLLADLPGCGKTNMALGLAALLKERGELTDRMVIVCQTPAVLQWFSEAQRWTPRLRAEPIYSGLSKQQRIQRYVRDWDILIIGYHMLIRDWQLLEKLEPGTLVIDDVDPILNDTQTAARINGLAQNVERCVHMNASVIQTQLQQVYSALLPVGGLETFGTLSNFERRYVRQSHERTMTRSGRVYTKTTTQGYRNGEELKRKLAPMYLRRTYEDLTDVRMPELMPPEHVWLELHPAQMKKYKELQQGVLTLKRDGKEQTTMVKAMTIFNYGQQICSGLPALGEDDGPQASVKLDWLLQQVTTTWEDRKVVAFIKNIGLVKAAEARLTKAGVGVAKIWGPDAAATKRQAEIKRFWNDPECRVLLGTAAVERSLNLQNANILVNVDTHLNPARMLQLSGRVRRAGSKHSHIWVFNLLTRETQEERYIDVLRKRQGLADFTWDEQSELYEALNPIELLNLITP